MEHELPRVLDEADEPVTVEELEGVVRRAGQRRRARLVAGAAALLAVGGVGGALARGPADAEPPAGYAGPPTPSTLPAATQGDTAASSGSGFAMGSGTGQALTPLFRREANGVAIRAYRTSWTVPGGRERPPCSPPDLISGQLSNGAAVTVAMAPFPTTKASAEPEPPLAVITVGAFGREEGEESLWVVARAAAPVAKVRVTVGGASDTMEPQGGIALLAVPATGAAPVVEGLGADGAVVATGSVAEPGMSQMPMDRDCFPQQCTSGGPATSTAEPSPDQPEATKQEAQIGAAPAAPGRVAPLGATPPDPAIFDGPICHPADMPPPPTSAPGRPPSTQTNTDPPVTPPLGPIPTTETRPTTTAASPPPTTASAPTSTAAPSPAP